MNEKNKYEEGDVVRLKNGGIKIVALRNGYKQLLGITYIKGDIIINECNGDINYYEEGFWGGPIIEKIGNINGLKIKK